MNRLAVPFVTAVLVGAVATQAAQLPDAHAEETQASPPAVVPYGFVRLDAIVDDSRMSNPQYPFWVESEGPGQTDDAELSIHPRLTRLGLKLTPAEIGSGFVGGGAIEIDFQNGGKESRALIRMRHAYLTLTRGAVEILAGQTSDLVSPLYPAANNDGMMWHAGNTGDRRPQLRVSALPEIAGGRARLAIAAGAPNAVNAQDADDDGQLDGLDAATPTLQGLAELRLPQITGGVWAHFARDDIADELRTGMLFGAHVQLPIGSRLSLAGEVFYGQNATDLRAGIGQGLTADGDELRTIGGWGQLGAKLTDEYTVTAGASIDAPNGDDLTDGMRARNMAVYLVQHLRPLERVQLGLEYLYWRTEYEGATPNGEAHRVNLHGTFSF